jgi:predicted metalloendopeptidase
MTHGFDKDGSEYDGDGLENDWWTAEDKNKFLALNDMFSTQISTFEAAPGIMTDGERTNTEDVADLGGLNIAFDAMTEHLKKKGVTGDELKEAQKKFFIRHALRLCTNYSAEDLQEMLTDEHSVDKIRVNGIIQHMDSWYDLFNVVEGDALYLPKEERIVIW